jgi:hypothetical protein
VKIKTKTKIIDNIIITKTISKPKPYQNQNHIKTKTISKPKPSKPKPYQNQNHQNQNY